MHGEVREDPGQWWARPDPGKALFVWTKAPLICPDCTWPPRNFQNLSGFPYPAGFSPKFVWISRIWPKVAVDEAGDLRNTGNGGLEH